jgi:hypothetical protein
MLRRKFGPNRDQNIIRVIKPWVVRLVIHAAHMRNMRNAYRILVEKLWRSRRRWEDNIKMHLKGTEYEGVD